MTAEDILKEQKIYFKTHSLEEIPGSIGYIKEFRLSWIATQLNTFVFIGETNDPIDRKLIETFSGSCYKYALKNNKGWPRGLQAGVASIAILKGTRVEASAIDYCESLTKKHWSASEIPAIYHSLEKRVIKYKANPIWGRLFFPYFTKVIDTITRKF